MSARPFALTFILPLLAACSLVASWHNPDLPASQEAADERQCRQEAESDLGPQTYTSPGGDRSDTQVGLATPQVMPSQLADQSDARREFSASVAHCMERKGYQRGG